MENLHMPNIKNRSDVVVSQKRIEKLAELEHKQWVYWSKNLVKNLEKGERLSKNRLKRWRNEWTAYKNLAESTKEFDRKWARKVVKLLKKLNK